MWPGLILYPAEHEVSEVNAPKWRIWLVTALVCGWGILALRFGQRQEWPMAALCLLLLIVNVVTLWRLTRRGK